MLLTVVHRIRLERSAPHVVAAATALSCLTLLTACSTAQKAIAPKVNVTAWEVPATQTNLIVAGNRLGSVAQEFGFSQNPDTPNGISTSYLLDQNNLTHAPYSITLAVKRDDPGITSTEDIPDLQAIAERLKHPSGQDALSQFLRAQFAADTLILLSNYTGGLDAKLKRALSRDLNDIIFRRGPLYEPARFAGVELLPHTLKLIEQSPQGYDLYRLNRILLDEAYPTGIRAIGKDRLSIHLAHANVTGVKTQRHKKIEERITFELRKEFGAEVHTFTYCEWTP